MNELTEYHIETIRLIEQILLSRAPRLCKPRGLTDDEVRAIADRFTHAHYVAIAPYAAAQDRSR